MNKDELFNRLNADFIPVQYHPPSKLTAAAFERDSEFYLAIYHPDQDAWDELRLPDIDGDTCEKLRKIFELLMDFEVESDPRFEADK